MAAPRLKPRVAVKQAEVTDAHVGIRLPRIHTNNEACLEHANNTTINSTTTAVASADYDYVISASGDYDHHTAAATAAAAAVNDDGTVEPQPLPLPRSARPCLREQQQRLIHNHRWARLSRR
jgi:hypothetical protein